MGRLAPVARVAEGLPCRPRLQFLEDKGRHTCLWKRTCDASGWCSINLSSPLPFLALQGAQGPLTCGYFCLPTVDTNSKHTLGKGEKDRTACWSPGLKTHWELDLTSVCVSYSWELKTSPSIRQVLRAVPLEEEMATHSNFLAWKTLWTEGPGGLQSMGSHRVRHDRVTEQRAACLPGRAVQCVRRVVSQLRSAGAKKEAEEVLQERGSVKTQIGAAAPLPLVFT